MDIGKMEELCTELASLTGMTEGLIGRIRNMICRLEQLTAENERMWSYIEIYQKTLEALYNMIEANRACGDMLRTATQMLEAADYGMASFFVPEKPAEKAEKEEEKKPETGADGNTVSMKKVQFSAVAPKTMAKGDYSIIHVIMYEEAYRHIVDEVMKTMDEPAQESRSGVQQAAVGSHISVVLSSPDLEIDDDTETGIWQGEHLDFSFAILLPEDYQKKQILLIATVYIDGVIASRLKFIVKCTASSSQEIEVIRRDIVSAFISYASQDRNHVTGIIQGMKKIRPELDVFFDVDSLRSGDNWEQAIHQEIERRDILFLCWSRNARQSEWVDEEWRYALEKKGDESIEPVPIEPPDICPPPKELSHKHFNERLLYYAGKSE